MTTPDNDSRDAAYQVRKLDMIAANDAYDQAMIAANDAYELAITAAHDAYELAIATEEKESQ